MLKSRNRDSIVVIESRSDLDHGIIGHVASDQNFADLGSTEHSVENHEMTNRESAFLHRCLVMTIVILGKELVQKSSVSKLWRSRNEVWRHSAQNCRMPKFWNECKSPWIQSNGAGEFEQDRRATIARHSETARNNWWFLPEDAKRLRCDFQRSWRVT